jgi:hypothetical protein
MYEGGKLPSFTRNILHFFVGILNFLSLEF